MNYTPQSPYTGDGNGTPLQYSCLENPMDGGAWGAAVHGVAKSRTWLNNFTFTFHFHALEKDMATHSSVLAWRIPGTAEPGRLPFMGSHRVGHDWSDLAAAAAAVALYTPHTHTFTHTSAHMVEKSPYTHIIHISSHRRHMLHSESRPPTHPDMHPPYTFQTHPDIYTAHLQTPTHTPVRPDIHTT